MGKHLAELDKEVLVGMVKFCQKRGMKGVKGNWKEFLAAYDRKLGTSLSDPRRRTVDVLVAFLQSFTRPEDLKFFSKMARRRKNLKSIEQMVKDSPETESPQQVRSSIYVIIGVIACYFLKLQKLVRITVEHPKYIQHYTFPSHEEDWAVIPLRKASKMININTMISIDCEMVLCEDGTESVVRVCAVDHNLEVKFDEIVHPNKPVADYRTNITGICSEDLKGVTCSLADVQKAMKKLLSHGAILVGHSLHNDLEALKIDHARVIDTSIIFTCLDMNVPRTPSLNNLCKAILGAPVRKEGDPHDCRKDAEAAMKLVLAKIERGLEEPITVEFPAVKVDRSVLFIHRVPVRIAHHELLRIFEGKTNVEIRKELKVNGKTYSTHAMFSGQTEAEEAFKKLIGLETNDSRGLPQKFVSMELSTGKSISFFVRKMAANDSTVSSPKRKRRRV